MSYYEFEWDTGNWPKCGQHGVSRNEIEQLFHETPAVMRDPFPHEPRWRAIGKTTTGRYIFVVFTLREVDERLTRIRPVSARYMHQKEVNHYEQST